MANRSYLYTVDAVPDGKTEPRPVRGVAEFASDVPWAHRILASGSPRQVTSVIWDGPYAICGDFDAGVARLSRVLDAVAAAGVRPRKAFDTAAAEARAFLADPAHRGRYFLLEAGEIFELTDDEPEDATRALLADVEAAGRMADAPTPEWLATVAGSWRKTLGIEWWSEVLYYSFPS